MKYIATSLILILLAASTQARETYYFLAKKNLSEADKNQIENSLGAKNIQHFINREGDFWQRYYTLQANNEKTFQELRNHKLVEHAEKPAPANILTLEPNQLRILDKQDLFFNFQWFLNNTGQLVYRDTDDIHPLIVSSNPEKDIGWLQFYKEIQQKQTQESIVAVIDSGLSITHSDLKSQVYKKDEECRFGNAPIGSEDDNDGNGYPGDCHGWNFASKNSRTQNSVDDDDGHGTHIAGIIAASTQNNIGVAGINDKIKILPIKIYNRSRSKDDSVEVFVQKVAKAILYAIDHKVDVINLSIGWPLISHIDAVKEAIKEAKDAGIIIVAGAGNDGHNARVLPCGMEGVLCVGATGIEGKFADFSNYGGFVDVLAPGEKILSTWPVLLTPRAFGTRQYEILSGTSQATPVIAALAATLKSIHPDISFQEVKARIALSTFLQTSEKKYSLAGLVQLDKALSIDKQVYIEPLFKRIPALNYHRNEKIRFQLPIQNLWREAKNIKIHIESPGLNFEKDDFHFSELKEGEEKTLHLSAAPQNDAIMTRFKIKVKIKADQFLKNFQHEITLLSDFNERIENKVQIKEEGFLRSVYVKEAGKTKDYYLVKDNEEGLEVVLFQIQGDQKKRYSYNLEGARQVFPRVGLMRLDMDYDGKEDYILTTVHGEGEAITIQQSYLDSSFKEKEGLPQKIVLNNEGIIYDPASIEFLPYSFQGKTLRLPYFTTQALIPKVDQNPDPFERETSIRDGFFTLAPFCEDGSCRLQARLVNRYLLKKAIRKSLNLKHDQDLHFLHFQEDGKKIKAVISYGLSANQSLATLEFSAFEEKNIKINSLDLPPMDLRFHRKRLLEKDLLAFDGLYSNTSGRIVLLDLKSLNYEIFKIHLDNNSNAVVGIMKLFIKNRKLHALIETKEDLVLKVWSLERPTEVQTDKTPIYRFSYLPGHFFTDSFFPVKQEGNLYALLTDSSSIHERAIFSWTIQNDGLFALAKNSFALPVNCAVMNPQLEEKRDRLVLQCRDEKGLSLLFGPLEP